MDIIKEQRMLCPCCMEKHTVTLVQVEENNIYRGKETEYPATYYYCENTEKFWANDEMIDSNYHAMVEEYNWTLRKEE